MYNLYKFINIFIYTYSKYTYVWINRYKHIYTHDYVTMYMICMLYTFINMCTHTNTPYK